MEYKKICFIIPSLNAGGIENYLLRVLHFINTGYNVTVIVRKNSKGDLYEEYKNTGAAIRFQSIGYLNFKKAYNIYRFFKEQKFSTVCDFGGNFAGITLMAAKMAGVPGRIAFYRRSTNAFKESKGNLLYLKFVNRLVHRYATKILSNSDFAFHTYFSHRNKDDKRFKVIPNGVNAALFISGHSKVKTRQLLGLPEAGYFIGHVGRFDKAKNHETIFKVAKSLTKEHEDVMFLFCGKDTDSTAFKEKLNQYGITNKVYTLGLRKDLDVVLKAMDIFYFPSLTEGQPNALIEAIMSGLPVIASDIKPIKEVIPHKGHSHLVNPLDVNTVLNKILQVKTGLLNTDAITYKDEIITKFDLEKNLKLFQDEF